MYMYIPYMYIPARYSNKHMHIIDAGAITPYMELLFNNIIIKCLLSMICSLVNECIVIEMKCTSKRIPSFSSGHIANCIQFVIIRS